MNTSLSKSQIMRGLQCEKSLWLAKHKPEHRQVPSKAESSFEQGLSIGEIAQTLFPNGELVAFEKGKLKDMAKQTQALIKAGVTTIYEATFINDGIFASIDILHKDDDGWHLYEVKGSTKVKGIYITDAAIQYAAAKPDLAIASVNLIYVNNKYQFHDELNAKELLISQDITDAVLGKLDEVVAHSQTLNEIISAEHEPEVGIGTHCSSPYPCDFSKYCRQHLSKPNVFNLNRLKKETKYRLYDAGVISYQDVQTRVIEDKEFKKSVKINNVGKLQIKTHLESSGHEKQVHINDSVIKKFVNKVEYPISYFDFETFNEAIPRFNGQRPYQQMPFQYSLHIESESGEIEHKEFLADEHQDPREACVKAMLADLPDEGSIMAFNQSFEISRIKELADALPEYREPLLALKARFVDLIVPFRGLGYYHPDFHGSFSIKSILPAMFPNDKTLDYKSLDIKNGGMAMDTFAALPRLKDKNQREDIRAALLAYCKLDTWAMVKIFHELLSLVDNNAKSKDDLT